MSLRNDGSSFIPHPFLLMDSVEGRLSEISMVWPGLAYKTIKPAETALVPEGDGNPPTQPEKEAEMTYLLNLRPEKKQCVEREMENMGFCV